MWLRRQVPTNLTELLLVAPLEILSETVQTETNSEGSGTAQAESKTVQPKSTTVQPECKTVQAECRNETIV